MHPLALSAVRHAVAGGARLDAIEHFDALRALDDAARSTEAIPLWRQSELLDMPVAIGDARSSSGRPALLYRPSFAALCWIEDCAAAWFPAGSLLYSLAVCWALAHAREPAVLRSCASPAETRRTVRRWAAHLNCSLPAMFQAATRLLTDPGDHGSAAGQPGSAAPGGPPGALAERRDGLPLILARLVAEYGQDHDFWLFGPLDRLNAALDLLRRRDLAEAEAMAKAQNKSVARDPDDPQVAAFRAWRAAADQFLASVNKDEAEVGLISKGDGGPADPGRAGTNGAAS